MYKKLSIVRVKINYEENITFKSVNRIMDKFFIRNLNYKKNLSSKWFYQEVNSKNDFRYFQFKDFKFEWPIVEKEENKVWKPYEKDKWIIWMLQGWFDSLDA